MNIEGFDIQEDIYQKIIGYIDEIKELLSSDIWENIFVNLSKNEILIFWLLRKRPAAAWLGFAGLTFVFFGYLIMTRDEFGGVSYSMINVCNVVNMLWKNPDAELYYYPQKQMLAPLAFVPCLLYNGKKGNSKGQYAKYIFYAFYPVHLWCLWFVQLAMKS